MEQNHSPKPVNIVENRHPTLEEAIQIFFDYLKMEDEPEPADAIFVLGGSSLAPVERAYELYKAGYAPKIAFTGIGGTFGGNGIPHHEEYRQVLLKKDGISEDAILSQGIATNTLNEAQTAIPFLRENGINPIKVILIARPVHQRRAFATFKKQNPEVAFINCPGDEPLDLQDPSTRERLVAEAERLLDYSKKGDIEKQEISSTLLRAAATIRNELKNKGVYVDRRKSLK